MNGEPTYQAARTVAATIEAHFAKQITNAQEQGEPELASAPTRHVIEAVIDAAFWASLRREEGRSPKISLAFLSPVQAGLPLMFEKKLPLSPAILTKLAPGVERAGIHLGVWSDGGDLYLWGTTREIRSFCFVVDVPEPGLLVIKHRRRDGFGKFANVAVLKGDQIKIVDEGSASLPDCPELLTSLLGFTSPNTWGKSVNVLVQLAVSMRAHAHGGSLLVVPAGSSTWQNSIVQPISYPVVPAYTGLADLVNQQTDVNRDSVWQAALRQVVESTAGLTAVDGATIMNSNYELLAFGAKIVRAVGSKTVEHMVVTEPIIGKNPEIVHPTQSGGTRHLSAAQFVYDQRDAMALVASQDGRFTIFTWSPCEAMVHAHRIDSLLL